MLKTRAAFFCFDLIYNKLTLSTSSPPASYVKKRTKRIRELDEATLAEEVGPAKAGTVVRYFAESGAAKAAEEAKA